DVCMHCGLVARGPPRLDILGPYSYYLVNEHVHFIGRVDQVERVLGLTPKALRTRERILEAALRLFAERGYEATTMRDVAREAGASLGLAYRYFASKE